MPWIGAPALERVHRALWAGVLAAAAAPVAQAQGAATPAAPAASVSESAVSERVKREASNPLRMILEASKIRRGPAEPEPVPVRRVVQAAATVSPAAAAPTPATPAAATSAVTPTVPAPAPAPPPEPATRMLDTLREPAPTVRSERIVTDGALAPVPAATPVALPAVPSGGPIAAPPLAALPAPAPVAAGAMPRLLSRVDPDIPSAVMRRLGYPTELLVQVTIDRDGRLRDIRMPNATQRAAEPYIIEALSQWRYEPVSEPRVQRLNLVFSN